jgi:NAD kinase
MAASFPAQDGKVMEKSDRRIVVIVRETRLKTVLESQNTLSQARFYINSLGGDFSEYEKEHQQYNASVREARQRMAELGNLQMLDRKYLPNFIFAPDDVVVIIGQDGLVANTLKYLDGQPVIGVNPDPGRWDGVLLPFVPEDAGKIVEETLRGRRKTEEVTMARARLQNGQELLAVNDFFIGQRTHVSARYIIKHGGLKEPQSSSGVIVSTGLGSTGWMKSVIAGASRISASVIGHPYGGGQENDRLIAEEAPGIASQFSVFQEKGGAAPEETEDDDEETLYAAAAPEPLALESGEEQRASFFSRRRPKKASYGFSELSSVIGKWKSAELLFAVREPFPSKTTGTSLVFGKVSGAEPLKIESLMGENGVIFSDGMESDFLAFNSGVEVVISPAEKRGQIVV